MASERGLLVPCPVILGSSEEFSRPRFDFFPSTTPTFNEVWQWLLLWDRFAVPQFESGESFPCTDGYLNLKEAGVMERVSITAPHNFANREDAVATILQAHSEAFERLSSADDTIWVSVRSRQLEPWVTDPCDQRRIALLRFQDAVPHPGPDTQLHDILEFRERRRDERQRLTREIDRVYLASIDDRDPEIALQLAVGDLKEAIDDYRRVGREKGFLAKCTGIKIKLDLGKALGPIASFNLFSRTNALWGLLAGVTVETAIGPRSKKASSPYEYAARISDELI